MTRLGDNPPAWKLPEGVDLPLWQYAHTRRLAEDEDEYFRDHPLFAADARALEEKFTVPGALIDLGCGAGRLSARFAARGFSVTAVDLSRAMLEVVQKKANPNGAPIETVRANLCRLGCFRPDSFRYAIAMFSTFGMIRGRSSRTRAVAEAARILEPRGILAMHAHNFWLNLRDSQGRRWLLDQAWRAARGVQGIGDRRMTYRGVPGMEVHLYRWGELRRDIERAGLVIEETIALHEVTARPIAAPWLIPSIRAGGWIVFARKP